MFKVVDSQFNPVLNGLLNKDFVSVVNKPFSDGKFKMKWNSSTEKANIYRTLIQSCRMCSRYKECVKPVAGSGFFDPRVMIIDSTPGVLQNKSGEALLWQPNIHSIMSKYLNILGIPLQDCFVSYAVHCKSEHIEQIDIDRCSIS